MPTYGRVSRYGLIAFASSLDHPGPFGKTVNDAALMLQAMAGRDPLDSTTAEVPVPNYLEHVGEPVTGILTTAPGNGAAIGGLKVTTEHGWFAARPSGTENVYKIYAESFESDDHLARIIEEAQAVVGRALGDPV